jgi:hypothetical protein
LIHDGHTDGGGGCHPLKVSPPPNLKMKYWSEKLEREGDKRDGYDGSFSYGLSR